MTPATFKVLQKDYTELQTEVIFLQEKCNHFEEQYNRLQHQVSILLREKFGSKSERYIESDINQLGLFINNEESSDATDTEEDCVVEETASITYTRRKKRSSKAPAELPRREVIIPVEEEDMTCICCGTRKIIIRHEIKELFNYMPAIFEIVEEKREIAGCRNGCEGSVVTAPRPEHILPKAGVTEEMLSYIITSKFVDRQPLYHLEKYCEIRYGFEIPRNTMSRWVIQVSEKLQPLVNLMYDNLLSYDIASLDATTLQVLNEPGRKAEIKSYLYCSRGGPPDKKVILFDYNYKDHKKYTKERFEGFEGYIHSDADPWFAELAEQQHIHMSYCNAHARRKFEPIAKASKKKGVADKIMKLYKKLYKIEREVKDNAKANKKQLNPEERKLVRLEKSIPILDEIKILLDDTLLKTLPKSPLGKAISYCINHWDRLTRFLEDGRLEIDNNLTEQEIKAFVIGRKNYMFAASQNGAEAIGIHMSLIRTALCNKLDPYTYYVHIMKQISSCNSIKDYEKLLPWNVKNELTKSTGKAA